MARPIACYFIGADDRRVDYGTPGLPEALEVCEVQDWGGQVTLAEHSTGQFPTLHFVHVNEPDTYLSITGTEGGGFMLMLAVVAKPGVFKLLGREAASLDVHDASVAQARLFIERFFTLDKQMLCTWAQTMPHNGAC